MSTAAADAPLTRRLTVRRSQGDDAADDPKVPCPMARVDVYLQRCGSCVHGQGLLLDPMTHGLTQRCGFPESAGL